MHKRIFLGLQNCARKLRLTNILLSNRVGRAEVGLIFLCAPAVLLMLCISFVMYQYCHSLTDYAYEGDKICEKSSIRYGWKKQSFACMRLNLKKMSQ